MNQQNKNIESIYPLSPLQQGMLFHSILDPGSGIYFEQSGYKFQGNLNISAFEKAWQTVVERHSVLRTLFVWKNCQKPLQIVRKSVNLPWVKHDWSKLSPIARQESLEVLLQTDFKQGFQLDRAPLMRCNIIKLAAEVYQFVWSHHHLLIDGWSSSLIWNEVLAIYKATEKNDNLYLPPPHPYKDYITWLQERDLDLAKTFWKQNLQGFTKPTNLPGAGVSSPSNSKETYGMQQIHLSRLITEDLQVLMRKYHLTLNTLLQGVWGLLLQHHSGQSDLVFGTIVSGRPADLAGVESIVGLLINTLPVRIKVSGEHLLIPWLQKLQSQQVERDRYAYSSLIDIQKWSDIPTGMPLFESLLVFENYPQLDLQDRSIELEISDFHFFGRNNYPLTLLAETSPDLVLGIGYDNCRFDDKTIAQMLEHLQRLLLTIVAQPDRSIGEILLDSELTLASANTSSIEGAELNDVQDRSNLTEHQLLIWLGHNFNPDALIYNNPLTFTIPDEIDLTHFQASFQVLINSSDALRTVFLEIDGVPRQKVLPHLSYSIDFIDLSQVSDSHTASSDLLHKRSQMVFDLEKCLFDVAIIKLSQKKFVWYINTHQIIGDGLSLSLIFNYLSELYVLSTKNCLPHILPIPQFQNYVDREKEYRGSARHTKVVEYWQKKLSEPIEPINFYGKTPLKKTTFSHRVSTKLGCDRTRKLQTLAMQQDGANLTKDTATFNTCLALLAIYLHHISGNRKFTIGIPVHNRRSPIFKKTIGSFVQIVPLHIEIDDTDNFQLLVKKIGASILTSLRYSQYVVRNPSKTPVYDVILNYHMTTFIDFAGSQIDFDWIHTGHSNESLSIQIRDVSSSGDLTLDFDFHGDVFDRELIDLAVRHFIQVIDALLEDINLPILQVSLLSKQEKERILIDFNQTQKAIPLQTFTQIFEEQTHKTANRVAAVFADRCLTYAQLNARSNQLAHYLKSVGVKPEVLVGVYTERSLDMLVAFLAILKAGGVYLPLDPTAPKERLAYILSDSQVSVLLTQKNLMTALPDRKAKVVCLDAEWEIISQQSDRNPLNAVLDDNLAYIIYTSGSTGMPKGAAIEHRGMLNHLYAKIWDLELTENDAIAQTASQSFDISVWQLLVALLVGGCVCIFPDRIVRNPSELLEQIEQQGISILEVVPSLLQMMLQEIERIELSQQKLLPLSKLRWLLLTGEALLPKLCNRWLGYYPTIPMLNAYGPTECSDDVTHYPIYHPFEPETLHVPIGRAIANTQLYILNPQLQPIPIGVIGELYVGGMGVGRGYLNNPELTERVFMPDPFGSSGSRLYKTGDKARYLSDNNIEFLGRLDYQVKLRGFRIELGEIEALLAQHPAVRESVVIVREESEDKRLVSYVVPDRQVATFDLEDRLHCFLNEKLPEYMMPSTFVLLESLPLTPNGKIDRQALPAPKQSNSKSNTNPISPRNSLELQLVSIWEEVLNIHPIGVQDNFFKLGGHSLLAASLVARIQQHFGKNLPLAALMQNPTIEQLATILCQQAGSYPWSPIVPIQPHGDKPPLFFAPGGAMDVMEFYYLAHHLGTDRPFYGLQSRGLDGELDPHTCIEDMASCYIESIQTVQPQGPYLLGGHSFGGYIAFEIAQQLQKQGQDVAFLAIVDEVALSASLQKPVDTPDETKDLELFARVMERFFDKEVELSEEVLSKLNTEDRLNYYGEQLAKANLLPHEIGKKQLQGFLRVSKGVSQAFDRYQPQTISLPYIAFFRAHESHPDDFPSAPEYAEIYRDPLMGWQEFSTQPVECHVVPGDHVTMMAEPHVQKLAQQLKICIDRALAINGEA
jgi:amino acid adenylation domain-containing protein